MDNILKELDEFVVYANELIQELEEMYYNDGVKQTVQDCNIRIEGLIANLPNKLNRKTMVSLLNILMKHNNRLLK